MNVHVELFGYPSVTSNGKPVVFPYKKAEALFYYLLIVKKTSRENLTSIFWSDFNDQSAKKNLRDALYKVKKAFDFEILLSPQKSEVELNPEVNFDIDIDKFVQSPSISLYKEDFLKDFYVKDCYDFEEWMEQLRNEYRQIYINLVRDKINSKSDFSEIKSLEYYSAILLKEEPYNESLHREMMKTFSLRGEYNKSLAIYYQLINALRNDLDVEPEPSTTSLFKEIIDMRSNDSKITEDELFFVGRERELKVIKHNLERVKSSDYKSCFISGEAGIGKTHMLNKLVQDLSKDSWIILKGSCNESDQHFFLQPWDYLSKQLYDALEKEQIKIPKLWQDVISYFFPSFNETLISLDIDTIERIESVKFQVSFDAVIGALRMLSYKKPIVIIFDDLHWMDTYSYNLLSSLLLKLDNIILIASIRDSYQKEIETKAYSTLKNNSFEFISLNRFNKEETRTFVEKYDPTLILNKEMLDKLYQKTEGIILFIIEYLHIYKENKENLLDSVKVENILRSKICSLNTQEQKILNISSVFINPIDLNFLLTYFIDNESDVFEALESLQNQKLLKEISDEDAVYYQFSHSILKDFIYNSLSSASKRRYNNKIANFYELRLKNHPRDRFLYPQIIAHFERAKNTEKVLAYSLKNLSSYSNINLEQFPFIHKSEFVDPIDFESMFANIDVLLDQIHIEAARKKKYEMDYLYIKGKYYIRNGEYKLGLPCIDLFIKYSEENNSYNHMLDGYHQIIYYSIQVNDLNRMNLYLNKIQKITSQNSDVKETGTLYRWKGLYAIRVEDYDNAVIYLQKSIEIFENLSLLENKYVVNIAAAYNYLGNINKYKGEYLSAIEFYKKAISLCESNNIMKGLDIFYTGLGQSLYESGQHETAHHYILKALEYFNKYNNSWGRAIAEGYAALLARDKNDISGFYTHLANGEHYANKMKNPYSLALIQRIKDSQV
ncbi:MAG: DUF2791 family P-loop domain-containing protein [Tissierellales bacterium]|nr:DUF2791 family P-loop domain-containing protein [Tissierellales bacterium]MBN2828586.1 DUF2791 family P-loop domain-containing protein [Tissierellales bacterium]